METTKFLAQFWGWLLIIVSLIFVVRHKSMMKEITLLAKDKTFTMISGYLALMLGLMTILLNNNFWGSDWRMLLTVFGWLSIVKGIARMSWPDLPGKWVTKFKKHPSVIPGLLLTTGLLGAWLILLSNNGAI